MARLFASREFTDRFARNISQINSELIWNCVCYRCIMTIEFSIFISTLIPMTFFFFGFHFIGCVRFFIVWIFICSSSAHHYSLFCFILFCCVLGYAPHTNQFIGSSFWIRISYIVVAVLALFVVCWRHSCADWCVHHNSVPIRMHCIAYVCHLRVREWEL